MIDSVSFVTSRPHQAISAIAKRVARLGGHRAYKKFIILTRSRTGSNMLVSMLNSHPNVRTRSEIFAHLKDKNYRLVLDNTFSRRPRHIKGVGFKIFYYHPLDAPSDELWTALQDMKELCVIHLKRRNVLRTLVSRKIAGQTKIWKVSGSGEHTGVNKKAIEMSVEELEKGFAQTRQWEGDFEGKFSQHNYIEVYYEDLVQHPEREFGRILSMLDLPYVAPETPLKKQNPEKLSQLVVNYDMLKAHFAGTAWASCFED